MQDLTLMNTKQVVRIVFAALPRSCILFHDSKTHGKKHFKIINTNPLYSLKCMPRVTVGSDGCFKVTFKFDLYP